MIYMKQLEIEEISRRLRSNDLGIPGTVCYAFHLSTPLEIGPSARSVDPWTFVRILAQTF